MGIDGRLLHTGIGVINNKGAERRNKIMCKESLNCLLTEKCTNEESIRADERAKVFDECISYFKSLSDILHNVSTDFVCDHLEWLKEEQR